MLNISKFIKENPTLCIFTLGLAIPAYLGYHAIAWIIHLCPCTKKIEEIANHSFSSLNQQKKSSRTPINLASQLDISSDKIKMGQGDYIVFHRLENGEKKELQKETYQQVYKILNHYSPTAIVNRGSENANEECVNRYELIKTKLKDIDETLEVVFVPRTLHELVFIRECIKEDMQHQEICPWLEMNSHAMMHLHSKNTGELENYLKEKKASQMERKCWHLCYFENFGDDDHEGVKELAYRLNQVMLETLNPSNEGFTHQELSKFAEKEIEFLKSHHHKFQEDKKKRANQEKITEITDCNYPGPTTNFASESFRGNIKPMGIRDDADAQIILNAVTLECSKIAEKALLIYRGGNFDKDKPFKKQDNEDYVFSLSFGSSLFAGCIHDGGATAFHYMRNAENAYAISIPLDQLNHSPFIVPPTNTLSQLFAHGETFHGRTKAWNNCDHGKILGLRMDQLRDDMPEYRISKLDKEEFIKEFQEYKNQAIHLK